MLLRLSAVSLVANCVLAPLAAQELPARPPLSAEDVLGVGGSDGELHAVTQAYVARFDPGAVELTPAFGRSARRTYPMRISMRSIGRGARESWRAAPGHAPLPELTETSVSYEHAAGIVERYDARTDGLKQSVVFAAEPEGRGDLVVRYALETDLRCAPTERAASLWFAADEVGGVAVGAVTGIDAAGRRADGHMAFDGTELVLTLPEAFVATASYPLELDPLFGPQLNTGVSFDDHFPDIAYDAASGVWGVAFEFPASATSSAAYMMRQDDATGAMLGGVFLGNPGAHPGIASVRQAGRFLVVWQDNSSGAGNIRCRAVRASDGALSNTVTVAGTPADEVAPDVGGDAFAAGDLEALVVWETAGVGIEGVQVTVPVNSGDPVVVGAPVTLDPTPGARAPAISKSGGFDPANGGRYVIAWELPLSGVDFVGYVGVDRDLNLLTPMMLTASGLPIDNPDVDGDGTEFLIVFESRENGAGTDHDIWGQPVAFCAGGAALCGPSAAAITAVPNDDERQPAVACVGPMFVVAWADSNPGSTTEYRIGATNVARGTTTPCNQQVLTGNATAFLSSYPALCAKRTNGVESDEALLTWEQRENSTGNSLLRSHRYRPFNGGLVVPVPGVGGCGAGGNAAPAGPFAVGNAAFGLTLQNADPSATAGFLLFDTTMSAPTTCGACALLTPQLTSPLYPVVNGNAAAPLPIPCLGALIGFTLDAQWAVLGPVPAAPPCPFFPDVRLSDAIRMVLSN